MGDIQDLSSSVVSERQPSYRSCDSSAPRSYSTWAILAVLVVITEVSLARDVAAHQLTAYQLRDWE
jgi:hypothetical protein